MPKYEIVTTVQVARTYVVEAALEGDEGEAQARKRLRAYVEDADAVAPGIVVKDSEKDGQERIKSSAVVVEPAEAGPSQPEAEQEKPKAEKPGKP